MPKTVELWGGLHDGGKVKVPHDVFEYTIHIFGKTWVYKPENDSDLVANVWRYQPDVHQ